MRALLVGGPGNRREVEAHAPLYSMPHAESIVWLTEEEGEGPAIPPTFEIYTYLMRKYHVSTLVPESQRFRQLHDSKLVEDDMNFLREKKDHRSWYSIRVWAEEERHERIDFRFGLLNEAMNEYLRYVGVADWVKDSHWFKAELDDRRDIVVAQVLWIIKWMSPDP